MTLLMSPQERARVRPTAVRRLRRAQEQRVFAERWHAAAAGTPREPRAAEVLSELSAAVSGREEWLHWIDHNESIRPEADGEWKPQSDHSEAHRMG